MKLQRREKILLSVTGGLLVLAAVYLLFFAGDSRTREQLAADRSKLTADIENKQIQLRAAQRDAKRLAEWQQRSLPADAALAGSLYQNWLRRLAEEARFRGAKIKQIERGAGKQFTRMAFELQAEAKLRDLINFFHQFHSAGYLHRIRTLDIKPKKDPQELELVFTIEALSLRGAKTKGELPKEPGRGLRLAKVDDYRDPIVERNFFAAYRPPDPPPSRSAEPVVRREPAVDHAEHTHLTGIGEVDGRPLVWVRDFLSGEESMKKASGESLTVGVRTYKVESIGADSAVFVDSEGHRRRLRLGDSLRGGETVDPEKPAQGGEEN
jgi:Tfp pilus assembly protein PilO